MSGPGPGDPADERDESDDYDRREESSSEPYDDDTRTGDGDPNRTVAGDSTRAGDRPPTRAGDGESRGREWGVGSERTPSRGRSTSNRSGKPSGEADRVTIEDDGVVRWFLSTDDGRVVALRDVLTSVAVVALVGVILFGLSGVWPPLVAVESGSMEPNMHRGDLIFVVGEDRFVGDEPVEGTGVVTLENGEGGSHEKFGKPGDVIIFRPDGSEFQTPVIHRAHFWVEEDENWVDTKANPDYVGGASCEEITTCPAEHDGFITKGDANRGYDQAVGGASTDVVKAEWVTGKGMIRVPWLGHVRLAFDDLLFSTPVVPSSSSGVTGFSTGTQAGLVAVASVAAFAGSRRPGSW